MNGCVFIGKSLVLFVEYNLLIFADGFIELFVNSKNSFFVVLFDLDHTPDQNGHLIGGKIMKLGDNGTIEI